MSLPRKPSNVLEESQAIRIFCLLLSTTQEFMMGREVTAAVENDCSFSVPVEVFLLKVQPFYSCNPISLLEG